MKPIFISQNLRNFKNKITWKSFAKWIGYFFGGSLIFALGIFLYFSKDLPTPESMGVRNVVESTKIYDRTGEHLLYEIHGEEKRTIISFKEIPDNVKYATIALEDQDFYSHYGIKISSIFRSIFKDVLSGGAAQGGSTITQQLIKNSLLTNEKTVTRKIKEVILALELEQKYSKDEILEMYLNQIPYGSNAYGVEAAAQTFFKKSAKDLTLPEAALIASLPQAPSFYSPLGSHTDELKWRQESALKKMASLGYITEKQAEEAKNVDIIAEISPSLQNISAPHFVMYVKEYLEAKYGQQVVERGGLKVYTTLDWDKQEAAEKALVDGVNNNKTWNASNAALVAIDPKTGQILAMVGSKDYFDKSIDGNVNVAIRQRQPGSSFKPYVYLTAFTKGYTPETLLFDVPTNFSTDEGKDYKPLNYNGKFNGPLQMKNTLAMSLNIPAVKTLYLAGVNNSINLAKNLGINGLNEPDRYGLSLVLGGGEVTLLDHTSAYATIANNGVKQDKTAILRIEDNKGDVLEKFQQVGGVKVVDEKYLAMLDYIMSTNDLRAPVFGNNNPLKFDNRPVAAKTGTTNEWRDGWTMGYTPSIAVGVWAGNNDNSIMKPGADGIFVAAPIWRKFMDFSLGNSAIENFPKYEKEETGKPVLDGKMDVQKDLKVCKISGSKNDYCLATDFCPSDAVEKRDFADVHDILYYVDKNDPRGDYPKNPGSDPQFKNWEKGVLDWWKKEKKGGDGAAPTDDCTQKDFQSALPSVSLSVSASEGKISMSANINAGYGTDKITFSVNGSVVSSSGSSAEYVASSSGDYAVSVEITDQKGNKASDNKNVSVAMPIVPAI
jgi:1A family penicillin-binding protein